MKKLSQKELAPLNGGQIVDLVTTGVDFVFEHKDQITEAFKKIAEFFRGLGGKNSPTGRLKRIEILEAQNQLQKEENKKLWDAIVALQNK